MAEPSQEVFSWLRNLPVAPEYHPTLQEFQDPIAYIFKIEKEASQYGICKIVPPVPPPSKKSTINNLTRSLAARSSGSPTFTTRQQQIGFCPRKPCPVKKPVWQSGETYTYHEFESKARAFEKNYLKKYGKKSASASPSALEIETLYWKAATDKPFSVEYANDMPGSAFGVLGPKRPGEGAPLNVGETNWNMRGVSRSAGSLLRFMKEEIPGVTSPMVYLAMLFSWFAWHVEDHDLHSLNYMHMGAAKTWYGVPRDAAVAFEEVVRVQGYGGEVNPLVTFAILGEKTTVISPEVLVGAGVPCCRLVQNAGEFVVTFPRAYHSGFSHGFNCGEAANIATPEWLRMAKDAAIRRASINYPPMVSHFQLLYDLALALCSRMPNGIQTGPRSSRLKDKKKGEGESMIKEQFVQDVKQNNDLLHELGKGSPIILLPKDSSDVSVCSNLRIGSHTSLGLNNPNEDMKSPGAPISDDVMSDGNRGINPLKGSYSMKAKFAALCERRRAFLSGNGDIQTSQGMSNKFTGESKDILGDMLSDQRLFSCVTCGILTFSCAAIVRPRESAARHLMSAECSFFNDWNINSGVPREKLNVSDASGLFSGKKSIQGTEKRGFANDLYDVPLHLAHSQLQSPDASGQMVSSSERRRGNSALGLIGLNYGDSSDSEDEHHELGRSDNGDENSSRVSASENKSQLGHTDLPSNLSHQSYDFSAGLGTNNTRPGYLEISNGKLTSLNVNASCSTPILPVNEDSRRLHVFCLEHALEVERRLGPIGGADIFLLCHPDYPNVESQAKLMAAELGIDNLWNETAFRNPTREDEEKIRSALDSEDAIPGTGDWAVKLGINLFYSVSLSWSSLYSKQMPYNSVIYNAFGRNSSTSTSPMRINDCGGKKASRQRNVVAGKWCGRVWKSNQVHPFLAPNDPDEAEEELIEEKTSVQATKVENTPLIRKYERKRKTGGCSGSSKRNKCFSKEEEFEESNDSFVGTSKKQKQPRKGKAAKSNFKREANVSEDEADDFGPRHRGTLEGKWGKSVDRDFHDNSNDSLEGQYEESQSRTIYRAKPAQFTPVEDVNSDVSLSGDSQHETRVTRGKLLKRVDEEQEEENDDEVSDGSVGLKKRSFSKGKLGAYESENDSMDGEKSPPLPRILRNKRRKQQVVQNMLREISQHVGNPHPMKGRISLPVKRRTPRVSKDVETPQPVREETEFAIEKEKIALEEEPKSGPRTRLRSRALNPTKETAPKAKAVKKQTTSSSKKNEKPKNLSGSSSAAKSRNNEMEYSCDVEGCNMSFGSKQELVLHKKNICPVKGCGKKFFSHKYLVQHRRVHEDDRPLKCPWKGCKMTFKWAWARTEHIRVHTGVRPYVCGEPGCGQTFRFVSDFSRHKRKTGHSIKGKG